MRYLLLIILLVYACENEGPFTIFAAAPDFTATIDAKDRKRQFLTYLAPIVRDVNESILQDRHRLREIKQQLLKSGEVSWLNRRWLTRLAHEYKTLNPESELPGGGKDEYLEFTEDLLCRVDIVPPSLALLQAAKESGWGTSRFAREANNYYGQRCFAKDCGLVPQQRADDKIFEVRRFSSPKDSVQAYIHNLNTLWAYEDFRTVRCRLRANGGKISGRALLDSLERYSERGEAYIHDIKKLITRNQSLLNEFL